VDTRGRGQQVWRVVPPNTGRYPAIEKMRLVGQGESTTRIPSGIARNSAPVLGLTLAREGGGLSLPSTVQPRNRSAQPVGEG